jgi:hypothetical protein
MRSYGQDSVEDASIHKYGLFSLVSVLGEDWWLVLRCGHTYLDERKVCQVPTQPNLKKYLYANLVSLGGGLPCSSVHI